LNALYVPTGISSATQSNNFCAVLVDSTEMEILLKNMIKITPWIINY